jgi:hypothetical protein
MIQISLAINGHDCTTGDGNTPEEYEAIAVTPLRAAEAIRNLEEGRVECLAKNGKVLASVLVHDCGPACDGDTLADVVTIEQVACVDGHGPSLVPCHGR